MNITLDQQIEEVEAKADLLDEQARSLDTWYELPEISAFYRNKASILRAAADTLRNTAMRQIEDAPKDGTEIDIWIEGYKGEPVRIPDCRWLLSDGEWVWCRYKRDPSESHSDSWQEIEDRIIGWMPIPVFPTGEEGTAHVA